MSKSIKKQAQLSLRFLEILGQRPPNQILDVLTLNTYIPEILEALNQFFFDGEMGKTDVFWVDKSGAVKTVKNGKLVLVQKKKVSWNRGDAGCCDWVRGDWKEFKWILLSIELVTTVERLEQTIAVLGSGEQKCRFSRKKYVFDVFEAFLWHLDFTTIINSFSTFFRGYFQPQKYFKKVENFRIYGPVFDFFGKKSVFREKKICF